MAMSSKTHFQMEIRKFMKQVARLVSGCTNFPIISTKTYSFSLHCVSVCVFVCAWCVTVSAFAIVILCTHPHAKIVWQMWNRDKSDNLNLVNMDELHNKITNTSSIGAKKEEKDIYNVKIVFGCHVGRELLKAIQT